MPKIDYKMMREINGILNTKVLDLCRYSEYVTSKQIRENKRQRELNRIFFSSFVSTESLGDISAFGRSYTGPPIYQPKTLKERLG